MYQDHHGRMAPGALKVVLVADVKDAPFKCFICRKVFISNTYLSRHIERRHSVNSPDLPTTSLSLPVTSPSHSIKERSIDPPIVENTYLKDEGNRIVEEIWRKEEPVVNLPTEEALARDRQGWLMELEERLSELGADTRGLTDIDLHTILTHKKIQDLYITRHDEAGRLWRQELREELSRSVDAQLWSLGTLTH